MNSSRPLELGWNAKNPLVLHIEPAEGFLTEAGLSHRIVASTPSIHYV